MKYDCEQHSYQSDYIPCHYCHPAPEADSRSASCSEPERRRVVIEISCEGTPDDADAIRDAIGESLDDDHLMPVVMEVMERRGMQGNTLWDVRGDRWVPAQNDQDHGTA
jgi:hypothetical protein